MKTALAIFVRLLLCLALAAAAYLWATSLLDSVYAYRSPLRDTPPQPGNPLLPAGVQPATQRLVIFLIDGLRLDTALDAQVMPTLASLRQQGAWATMHSQPPTFSAPSYTSLFTGAWPDISDGPAINPEGELAPTWTQDDLFSAAHRAGLKTAISGYIWFEGLVPQTSVAAGFYTPGEDRQADVEVMAAALPWLQTRDYQLVLIHLDQVDYAGHHEGGALDPRWNEAAARTDEMLAQVVALLDLRPDQGLDTLLVLSDHGHIDRGGHGGIERVTRLEPFLLVGAGIRPGDYNTQGSAPVQMVDVTPTLAALLGTSLPASSQGRVLLEMLNLPDAEQQAIPPALAAQQSQLYQAYATAIGRSPETIASTGEDVSAYQAALQRARLSRLNAERLPRILIALLAVILPLIWFWKQRRREIGWFLGGGLLYLALFNLRYAVLDGRTYSLSSVISADDLILFTATTAAGAFLVSWLLIALLRKTFRLPPSQASLWTFDLGFAAVYLLMLFALWTYALNGAVITWTLPDFLSMFLGFLSLLQILIVAVLTLLLAALAALIARFVPKKAAAPR